MKRQKKRNFFSYNFSLKNHKEVIFGILFLILLINFSSAARLPTIGGDSDAWGTVLNEFLNTSLNDTGHLRDNVVSTNQITNGAIVDNDISDTTNLTLGQKITFALGGIIDNIINGMMSITGNLDVVGDVISNGNNLTNAYLYSTNGTYYLATNPFSFYNSTNPSPTYNSTYNTWAYNQTTPAVSILLGYNYYNSTTIPLYATWANAVNGTLFTTALYDTNYSTNDALYRSITNTSYYSATNPFSFYNSTTLPATTETLWNANYSTFLAHIDWSQAFNGTLFKTADFNSNYTANDADWRTTYNSTYNAYNSSGFIRDWNSSGYIINWSDVISGVSLSQLLGFNYYNSTNFNINNYLLTSAYNSNYSTNDAAYRSITNTSYYLATNPFAFYNSTTLPATTETLWNANYSDYLITKNYSLNSTGSGVPTGAISAFNLVSCPTGWVLADGTAGTPDLRGIFIRGSGTNGVLSRANGTAFIADYGTYANDMFQAHSHLVMTGDNTDHGGNYHLYDGSGTTQSTTNIGVQNGASIVAFGGGGTPRTGNETSPAYYATIYCVKTAEDTPVSNTIWGTLGNVIQLNNASNSVNIQTNLSVPLICLNGNCQSSWSAGGGNVIGVGSYGYIPMWNGTTSMNNSVIYQNGSNIGIGTTAPNGRLDIKSTGNGTFLQQWTNSNGNLLGMLYQSNTGFGSLYLSDNTGTYKNIISSGGNSYFNGGNVGIGTTSPQSKLDVQGNANIGYTAMKTYTGTGAINFTISNLITLNGANWRGAYIEFSRRGLDADQTDDEISKYMVRLEGLNVYSAISPTAIAGNALTIAVAASSSTSSTIQVTGSSATQQVSMFVTVHHNNQQPVLS